MSEIHDNCMSPNKVKFNKNKHAKCDWITQGIIQSIQLRDNLYPKMKQAPSNIPSYLALKTNLKTYNKILKRNIEQTKRLYYETSFNKYKNGSKGTWKVINELTNRTNHKKQVTNLFKVDGEILTERNEIANKFNKYFKNIGPLLASKISTNCNKTCEQFLLTPNAHKFTFSQIIESDVIKIINSLPSKNSSGVDGISPKLLKTIQNELIKPVTLIINQCINTGIFPDKLKVAKVVPILKGNDATISSNCRPISILPIISKVFEIIIFNQIHEHFTTHNLYYAHQYGLRKGHSTEHAMLEVIDRILQHLDKGETPINIYLDKLQHCGIHGTALDLLKSYLTKRHQYVIYNEIQSNLQPISTGVPQGSILGSLILIIYINDVAHSSKLFHFVTTLCSTLDKIQI